MTWLSSQEDEVRRFHPEFRGLADAALAAAGLEGILTCIHHPTEAIGGTPDFVLREVASGAWVLAVEIKRTIEAVHSARFQLQAKGYAEYNQNLFRAGWPRYFAISNLELTLLFALNDGRPPRECLIEGGIYESGSLGEIPEAIHRARIIGHLEDLIRYTNSTRHPSFDLVWPAVLAELMEAAEALLDLPVPRIAEPTSPGWELVREYFVPPEPQDSARILLLRCLVAEYLRGALSRHGHPQARSVPAITSRPHDVARTIDSLRAIDFFTMFEPTASDVYRGLSAGELRRRVSQYVVRITTPPRAVGSLARTRVDAPELIESLMSTIEPVETQDDRGKVQTDPELAIILATLAIEGPVAKVLDPCCGDGALLSAGYERLRAMGMGVEDAVTALAGIEADPIALRLASLRVVLKAPAVIDPAAQPYMIHGDMFAHAGVLAESDVVLMNPPFRRYEAQDARPVPPVLREHYTDVIRQLTGRTALAEAGQSNLYAFYVEFVAASVAPGSRVAVILDNRWYHSGYGRQLRELFLRDFEILALVEYPYRPFFAHWTIATSIVVARRIDSPAADHPVRFVRCKVDPRGVDLDVLADAFHGGGPWPPDWTSREERQGCLVPAVGWKRYFATQLQFDFRRDDWPTLDYLFDFARRGSLQKEGGGIHILEFPFGRSDYGPRRLRNEAEGAGAFSTREGEPLAESQNEELARLAEEIPDEFRGWALRNANDISGYVLTERDVTLHETLESPYLRDRGGGFRSDRRVPWTNDHERALDEMRAAPGIGSYIEATEELVNLTDHVLPRESRWVVLREPYAGELVIPRKTREGHRVHINPFALMDSLRQVRLSSNFISYGECVAVDSEGALDRETAVYLIAAFLLSSFGQLQFEVEGYNREGLLALEKAQLSRIKVFDPRWVRREAREAILAALRDLPYPISTDRPASAQPERNRLDELLAEEIAHRHPDLPAPAMVEEIHSALDEWLEARQP
jgi:hypothetical protein